VEKFQRAGWRIARQKWSHIMLVKTGYIYTLAVPMHKELGVGLIRKLLQQAKLSPEEFDAL
jgi:predicted RNA binding protein YcfA (HicA-like mRNA interferase family)